MHPADGAVELTAGVIVEGVEGFDDGGQHFFGV